MCTLGEWNNTNNYLFLYHYTDKESAKSILKSKAIKQGKSSRSTFGRGVFMTILKPTESDSVLLENNYGDKLKFHSKTQCAFAFNIQELKAKKIDDPFSKNRDIWRFDQDINLNEYDFKLILRK